MALTPCTKCGSTAMWGVDVAAGHTTCRPCRKPPTKGKAQVKALKPDPYLELSRKATVEAMAEASKCRPTYRGESTAQLLELVDPARPQDRVSNVHKLGPVASYAPHEARGDVEGKQLVPAGIARNLPKYKRESGDRVEGNGAFSSRKSRAGAYHFTFPNSIKR
jgi:hypothetical protein